MNANRLITVLLVEDNPADVKLTQIGFNQAKFACNLHVASDGVEALEFLRKEGGFADAPTPDLILLDLNMPRMDGREMLAEVKADEILRRIPVTVLTSSDAERDIIQSYDLHANAFVTKPVGMDGLMRMIETLDEFWFTLVRLSQR